MRNVCVFVPCAKVKPYHTSPSHRNYDKVIFSVLAPEEVHIVTFGTCGITPRELDTEYPFAHYDLYLAIAISFPLRRGSLSSKVCDFIAT